MQCLQLDSRKGSVCIIICSLYLSCLITCNFDESSQAFNSVGYNLHGEIYVLILRYCANLKAIRYESMSLNKIVADKSHSVIVGDWRISGVRQWRSHGVAIGVPLSYPWRTFGVSMAHPWRTYGVPLAYSWRTFGVSMAYPWRTFKKWNCDDQFGTKCNVEKN